MNCAPAWGSATPVPMDEEEGSGRGGPGELTRKGAVYTVAPLPQTLGLALCAQGGEG